MDYTLPPSDIGKSICLILNPNANVQSRPLSKPMGLTRSACSLFRMLQPKTGG
jgi:hypothetical protein